MDDGTGGAAQGSATVVAEDSAAGAESGSLPAEIGALNEAARGHGSPQTEWPPCSASSARCPSRRAGRRTSPQATSAS